VSPAADGAKGRRHTMRYAIMKWWLPVFLWAVSVGGGLAPAAAAAADAAVVDRIVAVVNEDVVTLYDIELLLRPMAQDLKRQGLPPERERQALARLREEMLNNLIDTKLTEQEVKRYKIAVAEEEVDNHIRQLKQRRSLTDESLKAGLAQEGLTLEEYRKEVKLQIQRSKLVNREVRSKVVITQAEIKDYYEKNKTKYGGGKQYYLWNLFVKLPSNPTPAEGQAAKALLQEALAEVNRGRPFEELVRLTADGAKGIQGAELGLFRIDELTSQLRDVVQGMKPGQVSGIVESDFGYQVVYVQQINETAGKPMAQVEEEIQDILFRERVDSRFAAWLADLRKRSHVKIMGAP
jgi:peptidyl-prolyl cis-trans isomerase SurA